MWKLYLGLGILTAIVLLVIAGLTVGFPRPFIQLTAAACQTDDEIPAEERATLARSGMTFVETLLGANPEAAYGMGSATAQKTMSRDQFVALVRQATQAMGSLANLRVTQTHLVTVTMGQNNQVICRRLARREDWVAVVANPGSKHAHLVVEGEGRNNGWVFVLWLVPEPDWRVQYFYVGMASIVGRSAQDIRTLARAEQLLGHKFNAAVLYPTASQLAYRGLNVRLGISQEIQRESEQLELPPEIQGPAPFTWKFGNRTYKVLHVGPIGVGGKIYLTITQETEPWPDDQAPDRHNRALIAEFRQAFPEYAAAFAGLVVGARELGGDRLYRTVDPPEEAQEPPTQPE